MRATGMPLQRSALTDGPHGSIGVTTLTVLPSWRRWRAMVRSCDSAPPPPRAMKLLSRTMSTRSGTDARGAGSGCVDISPQPQLEHEEAPDVVGVVPAAALVLDEEALDERRLPQAAGARARVEQRVAH